MKNVLVVSGAAAALVVVLGIAMARREPAPAAAMTVSPAATPIATLSPDDLLDAGPRLAPSARAQALSGHRVRLVGHMAHLESPTMGGFYVTARPLRCDEAGGGTGDLPPATVLVVTPGGVEGEVPFVGGPIEMVGMFMVGNRPGPDGRLSGFRLTLEGPIEKQPAVVGQLNVGAAPNNRNQESP